MSRHRVPNDKRQRTAKACENCRRRKQKCNGHHPCHVCAKKSFICQYREDTKAEMVGDHPEAGFGASASVSIPGQHWEPMGHPRPVPGNREQVLGVADNALIESVQSFDEEAVLFSRGRMLRDSAGRLLYVGDSSTISYLHSFRLMVERISGTSRFCDDPQKGRIVEAVTALPPQVHPPCPLADHRTAEILIVSFFTNTIGLVDVVDHQRFHEDLKACYSDPLSANGEFLCLLYLIFAIGLAMATPQSGTEEEVVVRRLRDEVPFDQAELFFQSAKCHRDPVNGLENADFWSVQALALMSVYMLVVSRRNAAFVYHGMAVRSAISLGLHRKESIAAFQGRELKLRCSVWKTLVVMDRFLATSLGRPMAINEEEKCTEDMLFDDAVPLINQAVLNPPVIPDSEVHDHAMNTCIRGSRVLGNILKNIYTKRRVTLNAVQEVVAQCQIWEQSLPECMNWQYWHQVASRAHGIAILHSHLLYHHNIILLTRPFFLFLIQTDRRGPSRIAAHLRARTERFSEICVAKSYQTIAMLQGAREAMYLPQRDPFIMYYLFTAALVIMSNEFVSLFYNPIYTATVQQVISMMDYFSATDPQAERLAWILRALQDVIVKMSADAVTANGGALPARYTYQMWSTLGAAEPLGRLFTVPATTVPAASASGGEKLVQAPAGMMDNAALNPIVGPVAVPQMIPVMGTRFQVMTPAISPADSSGNSDADRFDLDYLWSWSAGSSPNSSMGGVDAGESPTMASPLGGNA